MRLLAAGGDRAAAMVAYEALRERMARELRAAPSPETRELAAELRGSGVGGVWLEVGRGHLQAEDALGPLSEKQPAHAPPFDMQRWDAVLPAEPGVPPVLTNNYP
jgi:hypothetical protein